MLNGDERPVSYTEANPVANYWACPCGKTMSTDNRTVEIDRLWDETHRSHQNKEGQ